jgi:signal transduction histidine kinase
MSALSRVRLTGTAAAGWSAPALDVAVALAATGVELGLLFDGAGPSGVRDPAVAVEIAGGLTLIGRRVVPFAALVATLAAALAVVALGEHPGGAPVLAALFTVADRHARRTSLAALVPTAVVLQAAAIASPPVALAAWALGAYAQARRRYTEGLEERAAHLEREREHVARLAAQEERTSIARELHDIVAHSVSVMLLGVRGARDVLRNDPDVAEDTLARVETSGEQGLTELRRALALLRAPAQGAAAHPQPSLADVERLVAEHRAAGMPVQLDVGGEPRPLAAGIELSAYRIVQEALTNVRRHTRPTAVAVRLAFTEAGLDLEVCDDGPPVAARERARSGHGIIGMRERAALLGGELRAGPRPSGGFRVTARLPAGER